MNGREGTVRTLEVRLVRSVQFPPSLIVSANFAVKPLGGRDHRGLVTSPLTGITMPMTG